MADLGLTGITALFGFAWLGLFQALLALGMPLGHMAWGGQHRRLPPPLRWGSAAVVLFAGLGAVSVAQVSGVGPAVIPEIALRPLLGAYTAVFALSLLANAASKSRAERAHGVALAGWLCVSCGVLALQTGGVS
jgi:hypothetical protein